MLVQSTYWQSISPWPPFHSVWVGVPSPRNTFDIGRTFEAGAANHGPSWNSLSNRQREISGLAGRDLVKKGWAGLVNDAFDWAGPPNPNFCATLVQSCVDVVCCVKKMPYARSWKSGTMEVPRSGNWPCWQFNKEKEPAGEKHQCGLVWQQISFFFCLATWVFLITRLKSHRKHNEQRSDYMSS